MCVSKVVNKEFLQPVPRRYFVGFREEGFIKFVRGIRGYSACIISAKSEFEARDVRRIVFEIGVDDDRPSVVDESLARGFDKPIEPFTNFVVQEVRNVPFVIAYIIVNHPQNNHAKSALVIKALDGLGFVVRASAPGSYLVHHNSQPCNVLVPSI